MLALNSVREKDVIVAVDSCEDTCSDMRFLLETYGTPEFVRGVFDILIETPKANRAAHEASRSHTIIGAQFNVLYVIIGPLYFAHHNKLPRVTEAQLFSAMMTQKNFDNPQLMIDAFLLMFRKRHPYWCELIKENLEYCGTLTAQLSVIWIASAFLTALDEHLIRTDAWIDQALKDALEGTN